MKEPPQEPSLIPFEGLTGLSKEQSIFTGQLLWATLATKGDPQAVYPLLEANLDKLDNRLKTQLNRLAIARLPELDPDSGEQLAESYRLFAKLIQQWPMGDKASNLEIAITCAEGSAQFFTLNAFPDKWASIQNQLGWAYQQRIQGDRARNIEQAINFHNAAVGVFSRENFPREWAITQNYLGTAYIARILEDKIENIEKAIDYHNCALSLLNFEHFPEDWATTQNHLGHAYCERIRGERTENIEEAIAYYQKALQVRKPENRPEDWADTQNNLGNAYRNRIRGERSDNLEAAICCYENSLQVYTQDKMPASWATIQNNLGNVYCDRLFGNKSENIERAINCYQAALQVRSRKSFPQEWAATQNDLGTAYRERVFGEKEENLVKAIKCYRDALDVRNREDFPQAWAITQNNLGTTHLALGQTSEAIECFWSALEIHTCSANPWECLKAARNLGDAGFFSGQWSVAINGYGIAIRSVEESRYWASTDRRRQEVMEQAIDVYANIIQAYINNGQHDQALEYVERSKSRNLVDLLSTRDLYPKGDIPANILNELQDLRREIVLEEKRIDIAETNHGGHEDRTRLNQLRQQLDHLITQTIQPLDPTFSQFYRVKRIRFSEIQALLPDNCTAIVEWYFLKESFVAFIVTPQSQTPILWQSSTEELESLKNLAADYLQSDRGAIGRSEWKKDYLGADRGYLGADRPLQLKREDKNTGQYKKLEDFLQELAERLSLDNLLSMLPENCNQVILIPHRFLHLIPLHALPFSEKNCLLDRFLNGVRYAPSCELLKLTKSQHRPDFNHLFAIENPLKDLRFSELEVETIRQKFVSSDVLVGSAAQKAAIGNQRLRQAHCVHFACHSSFDFQNPLCTPLVLASTSSSRIPQYEEWLILGEVFGFDLRQCRLVTLSACETGLTDPTSLSDEYIGLPNGFLYAGSPSVVGSLWSVNDITTAFLMIEFYRNLQERGRPVSVALNQAQLWLRDVTMSELKTWMGDNHLFGSPTIKMILRRLFHQIPDDVQLFREPFWWAAFCAIGQ